jgi:hypothetical protein
MTTTIPQEPNKNKRTKVSDTGALAARKADVGKPRAHAASSPTKLAPKATRGKKTVPARRSSKTAQILELLKRPGGVTLKELIKATGWQPHSVRGFLSGTVGKKMGTPVNSSKKGDSERTYRISSK